MEFSSLQSRFALWAAFFTFALGACDMPSPRPGDSVHRYLLTTSEVEQTFQASFRGLSIAPDGTIWASGSSGFIVRSVDTGKTWQQITAPGTANLDFRDVHGFSKNHALLMAAGTGIASALFETTDGGISWTQRLDNPDQDGFFDSITVTNDGGYLLGDPIDGRFTLFERRTDGSWTKLGAEQCPPARTDEHCFAASGTIIDLHPNGTLRIATGGSQARMLKRNPGGAWNSQNLPMLAGDESGAQGIFSVAFRDSLHGIAVGGDYTNPTLAEGCAARTEDGGQTWTAIGESGPSGYRSCVAVVPNTDPPVWVAVGSHGADWSDDDGRTWQPIPDFIGYHAVAFGPDGRGIAVGNTAHPFARFHLTRQD